MKDPDFINKMLAKGKEAKEKTRLAFVGLTPEQLNWKPSPDRWSIAQCLDHLLVADLLYFPALKQIARGSYKMSFWEKFNPFSVLFGRMLVHHVSDKTKKKLKAPGVFTPAMGTIDPGIIDRFQKHLDTLLEYIAAFSTIDLDRVHITSPVSKVVTYSLRNTINIIIPHLHRHINQAIAVQNISPRRGGAKAQ